MRNRLSISTLLATLIIVISLQITVLAKSKPSDLDNLIEAESQKNAQRDVLRFLLGWTDLVKAYFQEARQGKFENLENYLSLGFPVDACDQDRNTILMYAAARGCLSAVETLLSQGADINARNRDKDTPLICAVMGGQKDSVSMLLDKGASINACSFEGNTPLIWAVQGDDEDVVDMLLERGADTSVCNTSGYTALMVAAQRGNSRIIQSLLARASRMGEKSALWIESIGEILTL